MFFIIKQHNYKQKMDQQQRRKQTISRMKMSLSTVPILSKNVEMARSKLQRKQNELKDDKTTSSYCTNDDRKTHQIHSAHFDAFSTMYEMRGKIGQGANGVVRQCFNKKKQKLYACKAIMFDDENIPYMKKTFITVRALNNPSFVRYKALYIDSTKHLAYLVMEYIRLPNLLQYVDRLEGKISEKELNWIFKEIFKAVKIMHEKGICHRDLKPDNIMIDSQAKRIKILDFGVCKNMIRRKKKTDMLTITGTLFYRAPQTFKGGSYDQKVDIWSIGVTLYKIIRGVTPFQSDYISQTINNIQNADLKIDQIKNFHNFSFIFKDFLIRILKKQATQRLSAQEALKHLWFENIGIAKRKRRFSQNLHKVQTEYAKHLLPKIKQLDPKLFSLKEIVQNVNGNTYYRIQTEQI